MRMISLKENPQTTITCLNDVMRHLPNPPVSLQMALTRQRMMRRRTQRMRMSRKNHKTTTRRTRRRTRRWTMRIYQTKTMLWTIFVKVANPKNTPSSSHNRDPDPLLRVMSADCHLIN